MASTYSTDLKLELIGTGDQSGTWGTTTNTNLGTLLEQAIVGYVTQAVTDGAATVLTIPNGTSSNGRNYVIELTGTLTANRTVEVPAVDKPYIFFNNTTGGFSVTVKVTGQTGVTIANGKKAIVYTNSTDVIEVVNNPLSGGSPNVISVSSASDALRITQTGAGNALVVEDSANPDSTPFVVNASGSVGIGTSSPSYQLTSVGGAIQLSGGTTSQEGIRIQRASGYASISGINNDNNAYNAIAFFTSATEAMRIDSSGNVSIGTTTTSYPLTVRTSGTSTTSGGNIGLRVESNGSGYAATLQFSDNVANSSSISMIGSATAFLQAGTEAMRISSAGNVGIGGSPFAYGAGYTDLWVQASTSPVIDLAVGSTRTGTFYASSTAVTYGSVAAVPLITYTANTERMRIDSSGYVGIGTASPTAMLQVAGSSAIAGVKTPNILEPSTVSATAATGTINYDAATQSVLYYTSNASANWTLNIRASSGTSLNTFMAVGDTLTIVHLVTQGATAYYNNALQIDGSSVTPKYQGGTAWSAGNASGIDVYTYTVIKTASATFTVLASQTQFK